MTCLTSFTACVVVVQKGISERVTSATPHHPPPSLSSKKDTDLVPPTEYPYVCSLF